MTEECNTCDGKGTWIENGDEQGCMVCNSRGYITFTHNLINYKELSRLLAGGTENIRRNNIPQKYKEAVNDLIRVINDWKSRWI